MSKPKRESLTTRKVPDTEAGARRVFNFLAGQLIKREFKEATYYADPAIPGVWVVDGSHQYRATIYLAGYPYQGDDVRAYNHFILSERI